MRKDSYKVGITVVFKPNDSVYTNGIKQNGLMLAKVLKLAGHEVTILNFNGEKPDSYQWSTEEYKTVWLKEDINYPGENLDVVIHLQTTPDERLSNLWKKSNPDLKIVAYICGNEFVSIMQDVLFIHTPETEDIRRYDTTTDAVWYVPQQYEHNHDYLSVMYRKEAKAIPFVWDPMFMEYQRSIIESKSEGSVNYTETNEPKRISIFEPNIDVVKFCLPSILAVEIAYRQRPDLFKILNISGASKLQHLKLFKSILNQMDIVKDKKICIINRYPLPHSLHTMTDIVMSHQWGNPLNYLYLDAVYFDYPLIHNAEMFSDIGYYYEKSNMNQAAAQLINVAENHTKNIEAYRKDVKSKIFRYMPDNPNLKQDYTMLLDSLFDKQIDETNSWRLDPLTNRYL